MTHSFATRRSSDLVGHVGGVAAAAQGVAHLEAAVAAARGADGDVAGEQRLAGAAGRGAAGAAAAAGLALGGLDAVVPVEDPAAEGVDERSEEHTSELQSLMRISYAVFCLKK